MMLAGWLGILLLVAAAYDLKSRIIPNWLNLTIAVTAPLYWWHSGLALWPDIAWQVAAAAAVFAAFVAMFAAGLIGGGDVKMIGALALWVPLHLIAPMLLVMALVGGGIAILMLLRKYLSANPPNPELPYGVAIAAAGFWVLYQQYINHLPTIPIT